MRKDQGRLLNSITWEIRSIFVGVCETPVASKVADAKLLNTPTWIPDDGGAGIALSWKPVAPLAIPCFQDSASATKIKMNTSKKETNHETKFFFLVSDNSNSRLYYWSFSFLSCDLVTQLVHTTFPFTPHQRLFYLDF